MVTGKTNIIKWVQVNVKERLPVTEGDYFVIKDFQGQEVKHQCWFTGIKFESDKVIFWLEKQAE